MLPEGDSDVTSVQPERERATSQPANASLLEETAVFISRYYSKLFSTAQNIVSALGTSVLGWQRTLSGVGRSCRSSEVDVAVPTRFRSCRSAHRGPGSPVMQLPRNRLLSRKFSVHRAQTSKSETVELCGQVSI